MNIILLTQTEYKSGAPLPKRDARTVHLLKVLHKREGDHFDAGLVGGKRGTGTITRVTAEGALELSLNLTEPPPPKLPLELAVGFPRPIQLRRLLRDLTSMGVARIQLVETDLGDKNYRDTALFRDGGAESALLEGLAQARDTVLPQVERFSGMEAYLTALQARPFSGLLIAADNVRPRDSFANLPATPAARLAVGPERGWSDRERALLDAAGFLRLSLGSRALRTETACVAACAVVAQKTKSLTPK